MSTRFVIAGMQRSGTTVTQRIVQGHPEVAMAWAEIAIEPFFGAGYSAWTFGNEAYAEREAAMPRMFDAIAGMHADERTKARGFKVAVNNAREATQLAHALDEYLPDVRLVLTRREDVVAQFGSIVRARETGEWHSWSERGEAGPRVELDPEELDAYDRECREIDAILRTVGDATRLFEVCYERDILGGTDPGALFDFLGVARVDVSWRTTQKTAPDPADYIEDYSALRRRVARSQPHDEASVRDGLRRARIEAADLEHDYVLVRRAERFAVRGDSGTACDLAGLALQRPDAPVRVWLPAMAVLAASGSADAVPEIAPKAARGFAASLDRAGGDTTNAYLEVLADQDVPVAFGFANSSLERGEWSLAEAVVTAVLDRDPPPHRDECEWASQLLEGAWNGLGDVAHAVEASRRVVSKFRQDPALLEVHAAALAADGTRREALAIAERALAIDPGRVRANAMRTDYAE